VRRTLETSRRNRDSVPRLRFTKWVGRSYS
jgi:hypothetical protein